MDEAHVLDCLAIVQAKLRKVSADNLKGMLGDELQGLCCQVGDVVDRAYQSTHPSWKAVIKDLNAYSDLAETGDCRTLVQMTKDCKGILGICDVGEEIVHRCFPAAALPTALVSARETSQARMNVCDLHTQFAAFVAQTKDGSSEDSEGLYPDLCSKLVATLKTKDLAISSELDDTVISRATNTISSVIGELSTEIYERRKEDIFPCLLLSHMRSKASYKGAFVLAGASVDELKQWSELPPPDINLCLNYAMAMKVEEDFSMLSLFQHLQRAQTSGVKVKLLAMSDTPMAEVAQKHGELTKALSALANACAGFCAPGAKNPAWWSNWDLSKVMSSARTFPKELSDLLVSRWGAGLSERVEELQGLIPGGWETWAVQAPQKDKIEHKLLVPGLASKLSDRFASGKDFLAEFDICDGVTGHKLMGQFSAKVREFKDVLEETSKVVGTQYVCKWIYNKLPALTDASQVKQAVRDVRKRVKRDFRNVPADLLAQLTSA